jgi:hypothetical protein
VLEGAVAIEQNNLDRRDSMGIYGVSNIGLEIKSDNTDLLIVETAM